jgi:hypothetical protein
MPLDLDVVLRWVSIALFSILVPLGVYVGRMNVRASRREIVRDLERLFQFANAEGRPLILPSFELVKYKYDRSRIRIVHPWIRTPTHSAITSFRLRFM